MTADDSAHRFGGDWTAQKLAVLQKYLQSYTTALQNQPSAQRPFRKAYIDAFAGSGYRTTKSDDKDDRDHLLEFPEHGDANAQIKEMCSRNWRDRRAVLFLDPYGMQVEWATIESIARTKAIDLWLLFPLGIGVNRLLTKSGDIPTAWRRRLNLILGTEDWYDAFYKVEKEPNLFGDDTERIVKANTDAIGRYFNDRLRTVFAGVAEAPGVLRNSTNNPLYLLCFAVGNENGSSLALRIARHLLKDLR